MEDLRVFAASTTVDGILGSKRPIFIKLPLRPGDGCFLFSQNYQAPCLTPAVLRAKRKPASGEFHDVFKDGLQHMAMGQSPRTPSEHPNPH